MKKVKLARLPDRVPVKMQVTLPPDLGARLRDYADLYAETYGAREEPADLVPYMLDAFLNGDAEFRKALRGKAGKGEAASDAVRNICGDNSPAFGVTEGGGDEEVRELHRPPRLVGQRPDGPFD